MCITSGNVSPIQDKRTREIESMLCESIGYLKLTAVMYARVLGMENVSPQESTLLHQIGDLIRKYSNIYEQEIITNNHKENKENEEI